MMAEPFLTAAQLSAKEIADVVNCGLSAAAPLPLVTPADPVAAASAAAATTIPSMKCAAPPRGSTIRG
jgi:hypothetical protein